jgi:hypothetical protein
VQLLLNERIRKFNNEMEADGHGSLRPIYPVENQIIPLNVLAAG